MPDMPLDKIPTIWGPDAWLLGVMLLLLILVVMTCLGQLVLNQKHYSKLIERADDKAEKKELRYEASNERREQLFHSSLQVVVKPIEQLVKPIEQLCDKMEGHERRLADIHEHVTRQRESREQ